MKQSKAFPNFMTRIFSTAFDMVIVCLIFTFLEPTLKRIAIELTVKDMLIQHSINIKDMRDVAEFFSSHVFDTGDQAKAFFSCFFLYLALEMVLLVVYLVIFWRKLGGTPAKIFMRLKVVDQDTLQAPTTRQLVIRAFCTVFWAAGIWSIPFTKKRQALHDILSGTTVIRT
jgi:hypothetical protein